MLNEKGRETRCVKPLEFLVEWVHQRQLICFKKLFCILRHKRIKNTFKSLFTIIQKSLHEIYAFDQPSKSPLSELIRSALILERAGADFIIMSCHTAHIWLNEVKRAITIPFYSMIDNTVQTMLERKSDINKKLFLLASETTVNSRLYQNAFENSHFKIIVPNVEEQRVVDNTIKNVKAGKTKTNRYIPELNQILRNYNKTGVSTLLGCCTEIPLIFPYFKVDMEMIDPTLMLAKMAIRKATL